MTVTEQLRNELAARDQTLYRVAKESGMNWATLQRFLNGGGLRSEQLDKLAEYLGLELISSSSKRRKK